MIAKALVGGGNALKSGGPELKKQKEKNAQKGKKEKNTDPHLGKTPAQPGGTGGLFHREPPSCFQDKPIISVEKNMSTQGETP